MEESIEVLLNNKSNAFYNVAMAKNNEPYKCSFSISYEIARQLSDTTYQLGKFSMLAKSRAGDREYGQSALYLLSLMGITLRNSEMRRLKEGDRIPSTPIAHELRDFIRGLPKMDPYDRSFMESFEALMWKEGVPVRMSRRVENFPYVIPMHARVDALLQGVFGFAKKSREKIHPLILSAVLFFELMALAPYREHNDVLATLVLRAVLVNYDPVFAFAPIERFLSLKKEEGQQAYADAVEKGDMAPFLSFMLGLYEEALAYIRKYQVKSSGTDNKLVQKLLDKMEDGVYYSASEICELLGLKSRLGIQLNYLRPALEAKLIVMSNPGAPTDRNQRYKKA